MHGYIAVNKELGHVYVVFRGVPTGKKTGPRKTSADDQYNVL